MAVYNGFSTRKKESLYNELTFALLGNLQSQILNADGSGFDSEMWAKDYRAIVKKMKRMELEKFMPPKYTHACDELTECLGKKREIKESPEREVPIIQGKVYIATVIRVPKKSKHRVKC